MEEILASIRRIISEESEPAAAAPAAQSAARPEPAPVGEDDILELTEVVEDEPRSAPLSAQELADLAMADDDPEDRDMDADLDAPGLDAHDVELAEDDAGFAGNEAPDDFADDAGEPAFEAEPEPEMAAMAPEAARKDDRGQAAKASRADDWVDVVDPAEEDEAIISSAGAAAVRDSFGQLSDLLVAGYAGSDKTLEGMVREMLRPMLKNWLDANLPAIVERAVAREIARLARVKRP